MSPLPVRKPRVEPCVIATGFTPAFLGDERLIREFIVGDYVSTEIVNGGGHAILYLVTDSYDALTYRQLRIGVQKDEHLLRKFEPFCGRPIAEIPDPFGCHASYAQHFTQALVCRLRALEIYPIVLDAYHAYQRGDYADFVAVTLERYHEILRRLAENHDGFSMKNLFHVQCPRCKRVNSTYIRRSRDGVLSVDCEQCESAFDVPWTDVKGKLSWKLDCAVRWNLYGIDIEPFSKSHLSDLSTYEISRFMSEEYYGGRIPKIARYGNVRLNRALSNRLLDILPPAVFKALFTDQITRDIDVSREVVTNFCHKFEVRAGVSYLDYVRKELPRTALEATSRPAPSEQAVLPDGMISETSLIEFGNRFSALFFGREHRTRLPTPATFESVEQAVVDGAAHVLNCALAAREAAAEDHEQARSAIRSYLRDRTAQPAVYRFIRKVFGQSKGPSLATLLVALPLEYLVAVHLLLDGFVVKPRTSETSNWDLEHSAANPRDLDITDEPVGTSEDPSLYAPDPQRLRIGGDR